jgi:hypothetical protein
LEWFYQKCIRVVDSINVNANTRLNRQAPSS